MTQGRPRLQKQIVCLPTLHSTKGREEHSVTLSMLRSSGFRYLGELSLCHFLSKIVNYLVGIID